MQRNIEGMIERLTAKGVTCRPHVKSHKSIEIGRRQLAAGAKGLTAATIGEAEVFVGAGVTDSSLPIRCGFRTRRRVDYGRSSRTLTSPSVSVPSPPRRISSRALGGPSTLDVLIESTVGSDAVASLMPARHSRWHARVIA